VLCGSMVRGRLLLVTVGKQVVFAAASCRRRAAQPAQAPLSLDSEVEEWRHHALLARAARHAASRCAHAGCCAL